MFWCHSSRVCIAMLCKNPFREIFTPNLIESRVDCNCFFHKTSLNVNKRRYRSKTCCSHLLNLSQTHPPLPPAVAGSVCVTNCELHNRLHYRLSAWIHRQYPEIGARFMKTKWNRSCIYPIDGLVCKMIQETRHGMESMCKLKKIDWTL